MSRILSIVCALAVALGAASASAQAAPELFYSTGKTGDKPTYPPSLPRTANVPVYLFMDTGNVPTNNGGAICDVPPGGLGGNGSEVCAFDFTIEAIGLNILFTALNPVVPMRFQIIGGKVLKANAVIPATPQGPNPFWVGTLVVDASDMNERGEVEDCGASGGEAAGSCGRVQMLQVVDADLDLVQGEVRDLFIVPEPGFGLLLLGGVGGLAGLHRWRSRK